MALLAPCEISRLSLHLLPLGLEPLVDAVDFFNPRREITNHLQKRKLLLTDLRHAFCIKKIFKKVKRKRKVNA
jgi:hypothetical protein